MSGSFFFFLMPLECRVLCVCVSELEPVRAERRGWYKEGERTAAEIQRKDKKERATTGINNRRAPADPKPAVDKEPCGKRAERKRKEWNSGSQGNSENLFFS